MVDGEHEGEVVRAFRDGSVQQIHAALERLRSGVAACFGLVVVSGKGRPRIRAENEECERDQTHREGCQLSSMRRTKWRWQQSLAE